MINNVDSLILAHGICDPDSVQLLTIDSAMKNFKVFEYIQHYTNNRMRIKN